MSYMIILPVFIIFEAAMLLVALVACFFKKLRWFSGYLTGMALGSTMGFVVANAFVWRSAVAPYMVAKRYSFWEMNKWIGDDLYSTFNLWQPPYVASGCGILAGSLIGIYFVYRKRQRKIP